MDGEKIKQNISLFQELIQCNVKMYLWDFDEDGNLLGSNCPDESIFLTVFSGFSCKKSMLEHGTEHSTPILLGTPLGLTWIAAYVKDSSGEKNSHIYAVGPVFTTEISLGSIHAALTYSKNFNVSTAWKKALTDALDKITVVSPVMLNQFAVMLHFCVTGQKIHASDLFSQSEKLFLKDGKNVSKDRHKIWRAEQSLLRMVREGDINFRDALANSSNVSGGVPVHSPDPLRQLKISGIVFVTLCTRAAIEGGLSPEQAYALGDSYIQSIESTNTGMADIAALNHTMYEDFVHHVRKCRTNPNVSTQIRRCYDYIESHTEEKITISGLAKLIGYTEYYLSRKFKAEMKVSINEYIKITKIERAKYLLDLTDESIQSISDKLNFCSRSHFGEVFKSIEGVSPAQYRSRKSF